MTGREIPIGSSGENRAADVRIYIGDCGELHSRTNWRPRRSLRQIVEDISGWALDERRRLESI